jgi:hypothetical protein
VQNTVEHSLRPLNFMLANWYSGATLFALIISRHSEIECNGETFPFGPRDARRHDCTCGQYLDTCEFYRTACAHMWSAEKSDWDRAIFSRVPVLSRNPTLNRLLISRRSLPSMLRSGAERIGSFSRGQRDFVDAHMRFYEQALEYSGRSVYVDGTKSIRRAQLFLVNTTNRLKVVHLIRDGRAFANSFRKNRHLDESALPQAAVFWNKYIERVDELQSRSERVDVLTLRYEDLCRTPSSFLGDLFTFLDLDFEDVLSIPRSDTHVLGNRMRRDFSNVIKEDESWKQEVDGADQDMLNRMMSGGLSRFGYL